MTNSDYNANTFMAEVEEAREQDKDRQWEEICARDMDEHCAALAVAGLV
jgi:hypothetical protein